MSQIDDYKSFSGKKVLLKQLQWKSEMQLKSICLMSEIDEKI